MIFGFIPFRLVSLGKNEHSFSFLVSVFLAFIYNLMELPFLRRSLLLNQFS